MSQLNLSNNPKHLEQKLGISMAMIAEFCQRWQIVELSLFDSILREDFHKNSDIDFLIKFSEKFTIDIDKLEIIEKELKAMVSRDVDLIIKSTIENSHNWLKKGNILNTAELVYEQR